MSKRTALIGIDLMGNPTCPDDFIDALKSSTLQNLGPLKFILLATPQVLFKIAKFSEEHPLLFKEIELLPLEVSEYIEMGEDPLTAIRQKKGASICLGMRLLEEKKIDALITTGNTGAVVGSARLYLSMLSGISRPALLALMPTQTGKVAIVDVGANVQCKSEHLLQFATLGIAYQKSRGIDHPNVGILNIGEESFKGREELQEAFRGLQLLQNSSEASFVGNIEGREVFSGITDVLITDGFTGNILLKSSEGVATFIMDFLRKQKEIDLASLSKLNWHEYPGALLAGMNGIVIKCHGQSSGRSIALSIKNGATLIHEDFLAKMKTHLEG